MTAPYQILQYVSSGSIKFGFYSSQGDLFAYGNGSQGIDFFDQGSGDQVPFHGDLPLSLPAEKLEPEDKVEYLYRFMASLVELERAYTRIQELSPESEDEMEDWKEVEWQLLPLEVLKDIKLHCSNTEQEDLPLKVATKNEGWHTLFEVSYVKEGKEHFWFRLQYKFSTLYEEL